VWTWLPSRTNLPALQEQSKRCATVSWSLGPRGWRFEGKGVIRVGPCVGKNKRPLPKLGFWCGDLPVRSESCNLRVGRKRSQILVLARGDFRSSITVLIGLHASGYHGLSPLGHLNMLNYHSLLTAGSNPLQGQKGPLGTPASCVLPRLKVAPSRQVLTIDRGCGPSVSLQHDASLPFDDGASSPGEFPARADSAASTADSAIRLPTPHRLSKNNFCRHCHASVISHAFAAIACLERN